MLGNPMGLLNDVSSGLEGLVRRGNVGGLFINVAHGVSDSTAKVNTTSRQEVTLYRYIHLNIPIFGNPSELAAISFVRLFFVPFYVR